MRGRRVCARGGAEQRHDPVPITWFTIPSYRCTRPHWVRPGRDLRASRDRGREQLHRALEIGEQTVTACARLRGRLLGGMRSARCFGGKRLSKADGLTIAAPENGSLAAFETELRGRVALRAAVRTADHDAAPHSSKPLPAPVLCDTPDTASISSRGRRIGKPLSDDTTRPGLRQRRTGRVRRRITAQGSETIAKCRALQPSNSALRAWP